MRVIRGATATSRGDGSHLASAAVEPDGQRCRVSREAVKLGYSHHQEFGHQSLFFSVTSRLRLGVKVKRVQCSLF